MRSGLGREVRNPYRSMLVRGREPLAVEEAIRLIEAWAEPDCVHVEHATRAGTGMGAF